MKGLAYIFLLLFSWQLGGKLFILTSFQLNRAYIASNLCEKKAELNATCKGACYLKKQLQQQEQQENQLPVSLKDKFEVSVFIENEALRASTTFTSLVTPWCEQYRRSILNDLRKEIFHPPRI
ncbi:MAG: hypothetical protein ACFB0B_08445 [Thermonemataceae bacterium]